MAGSERSGVEAATPDLFRGAYYVLTPSSSTDADTYRRLHSLVTSLGARVIAIRPEAHDEAVAAISHVPHVAAAALTNLAAARADAGEDVLRLAAGGFKDMTRIAAGSPDLWTGICLDNRDAVVRGLKEYSEILDEFAEMLIGRRRRRPAGVAGARRGDAKGASRPLGARLGAAERAVGLGHGPSRRHRHGHPGRGRARAATSRTSRSTTPPRTAPCFDWC